MCHLSKQVGLLFQVGDIYTSHAFYLIKHMNGWGPIGVSSI